MSTAATHQNDEIQVKAVIEQSAQAIRDKDVDRLMAGCARDVQTFDATPPLQRRGADSYRKSYEDWFATWDGPIGVELRELDISASDDVAFATSLNHITGKSKTGENADVWMRLTLGLRKIGGQWKATHEHVSVPFDMQTQKAALDLKP
jgi:ketosteroid isomerase-like protein